MKNTFVAQTKSSASGDTYAVFAVSRRGREWARGPIARFSLPASGRGSSDFWQSPAGKFIVLGLPVSSEGQPAV